MPTKEGEKKLGKNLPPSLSDQIIKELKADSRLQIAGMLLCTKDAFYTREKGPNDTSCFMTGDSYLEAKSIFVAPKEPIFEIEPLNQFIATLLPTINKQKSVGGWYFSCNGVDQLVVGKHIFEENIVQTRIRTVTFPLVNDLNQKILKNHFPDPIKLEPLPEEEQSRYLKREIEVLCYPCLELAQKAYRAERQANLNLKTNNQFITRDEIQKLRRKHEKLNTPTLL